LFSFGHSIEELDAMWYERLKAVDDKWYKRNQKLAADHSTEMLQKCSRNATLIVEYRLFIFILISNFYIEHAYPGKNRGAQTRWQFEYP